MPGEEKNIKAMSDADLFFLIKTNDRSGLEYLYAQYS